MAPYTVDDKVRAYTTWLAAIYEEPKYLSTILQAGRVSESEILWLKARLEPYLDLLSAELGIYIHVALGDRMADIHLRWFGLAGAPPVTLQSLGDEYGLSRERVRQIREQSLKRLRTSGRRLMLASVIVSTARRFINPASFVRLPSDQAAALAQEA